MAGENGHDGRQRLDRWLWHARVVRTRPLAAGLAASGRVRVNGQRVTAAARAVKIGDVLTVALPGAVRVLRVTACAERRGGAADARQLYEDLSPPPAPADPDASRRGRIGARPTKRERRALEGMRQRGPGLE